LTFCSGSEQVVTKDCGKDQYKSNLCGYEENVGAFACWSKSAIYSSNGKYGGNACKESWGDQCGAFYPYKNCACDAGCTARGDCCGDFYDACGLKMDLARCGDGACSTQKGENCATCAADCQSQCLAPTISLDPPWAPPFAPVLAMAGTVAQKAAMAHSVLDEVVPAQPPLPLRGLLTRISAAWAHSGSPQAHVTYDQLGSGEPSAAAGKHGPALGLVKDGKPSGGSARVTLDAPLPRPTDFAAATMGGMAVAMWVKLASDAADGLHPLVATTGTPDSADERCNWSRAQDASVTVTCAPLGTTPRHIVGIYGYYGSVANSNVVMESASTGWLSSGYPRGSCAAWHDIKPTYKCEYTGLQTWLEAKCLGKSTCHVDPWTVAKDPCVPGKDPNIQSTLLVRALCAVAEPQSSAWLAIGDKAAGSRLTFEVPGLPALKGTTALNDGAWHHVALAYRSYTASQKSGLLTLYVDGQPEANTEALQPPTFRSMRVGAASLPSGTVQAGAEIDEVYVYDRALSDPEVRTLRNAPDLHVARVWPPVAAELAATIGAWGQGNATATAALEAAKVLGPGFSSSGQNTKLLAADFRAVQVAADKTWSAAVPSGDVIAGSKLTLAAWVKIPSAGKVDAPLLRLLQGNAEQVAIRFADGCGGRALSAAAKGGKATTLGPCDHGLQAGKWTFVSYVQDGKNQSLRIDGHELATGTAGATLLADAVTQTAVEVTGPAELGWAALFDTPLSLDALQRWRSQGPAVWLDGARYGSKDQTQLRDYADFELASDALAAQRKPTLWTLKGEPATGGAATGPLVLQEGGAAVLTVPAKGRFGQETNGGARPFTWAGHVRVASELATTKPVHLVEHVLAGQAQAAFAAALVCKANGASATCRIALRSGPNSWSTELFHLTATTGTLPPGTLDLDLAVAWDGKLPAVAVSSRGTAEAQSVAAKKLAVAVFTATETGTEPALDPWLTFDAFVVHAPGTTGKGLELAEARLYPRALTELELIGVVRRTCAALDCGQRICASDKDQTALPACGPCATGYREAGDKMGDVCMEARPFMATCTAHEQCTSGICAEGRCHSVAKTELCKSTCAAQHRQCVEHKSGDPAAKASGGKLWGCSGSCDPWFTSPAADPNYGPCFWTPTTDGGGACGEDLQCKSGKCTTNDTPKYDGSGPIGGPICAHASAQACTALHREAVAHYEGAYEGRTWYTCGGCAKDLYLGKPLWQATRRYLTKAACDAATAASSYFDSAKGMTLWLHEFKFNLTGKGLNKIFLGNDAKLVGSDLAKLRSKGVGPLMIAWGLAHNDSALVYDSYNAYHTLTLNNCDVYPRYNDPVDNAPVCVGTPYPDGTPCPPPGVSVSADQANEFCESGFCARDTRVCEQGGGKVEDTVSAARQDEKSSKRSDYGPITVTQDNRASLQLRKVAFTGVDGKPPQREYALATSVTHAASVFGSPSFDVVGLSLSMHGQMEAKKAQYQPRLFLFGVEMPAVKSLVPPSPCKDKLWENGEYQAPPAHCGVAMDTKTLTPQIPKIKFEKSWNGCEGEKDGDKTTKDPATKKGKWCIKRSGFIGPVPVSIQAAVETVVGLDFGLAIDSLTFEPAMTAGPRLALQVIVKGGVGGEYGVFEAFAGVKGELKIVELSLPVTWALKIVEGKTAAGAVVEGLYTVTWSRSVVAELLILKLALSLFAEIGVGPLKAEWEYPLYQSPGIRATYTLGDKVLKSLKVDLSSALAN